MMTPYEEFGGGVEFGPQRLEPVPYLAINELSQVRTKYDTDAIDELAHAIQVERDNLTNVDTAIAAV